MPIVLIVKAFALISFALPPALDYVENIGEIHYGGGVSVKGERPWDTETLTPNGTLPAIVRKGF